MINFISSTKIINNTEEAPLRIPGANNEHEKDFRVKPIVEIKIFFCWKSSGNLVTKLIRY